MTYYRVQVFQDDMFGVVPSMWVNETKELSSMNEAQRLFSRAIMDNTYFDVRLVKAFVDSNGKELIMEILSYHHGRELDA